MKGHSELEITYTAQHGCGDDDADNPLKLNCNTVLQYMCQKNAVATGESDNANIEKEDFCKFRKNMYKLKCENKKYGVNFN